MVTWSFVEFMGGKKHHCCGNKFTEILKKNINCVIINAIICKSNDDLSCKSAFRKQ